MRILSDIFRYTPMMKLTKGIRVYIIPSYACNYKCDYCAREIEGKYPKAKRKDLTQWIEFLENLDETFRLSQSRLKEVILTGGEPTILPYFVELSNWILDKGLYLRVYSNLSEFSVPQLLKVEQSRRLIITSTFHHKDAEEGFNNRWETVDRKHRVVVHEIGERRLKNPHKKTKLKPFVPLTDSKQLLSKMATLQVDPNFRIFLTCYEHAEANT